MLGLTSFLSGVKGLVGVELMHMIRKGQLAIDGAAAVSSAKQSNPLVGRAHLAYARTCSVQVHPFQAQQCSKTFFPH